MARLDEFQLFHEKRKRRPLGDVTRAQNVAKKPKTATPAPETATPVPQMATPAPQMARSKSIKLTQVGQVARMRRLATEGARTTSIFNLKPVFTAHSAPPRESPHTQLLRSLVDYNELVGRSNAYVRAAASWARLRLFHPGKEKDGRTENAQKVVESVQQVGAMLTRITTTEKETVLLMNANGVELERGNSVALGQHKLYEFDVPTKVYSTWELKTDT